MEKDVGVVGTEWLPPMPRLRKHVGKAPAPPFAPGDVVQLRSGGPPMTVTAAHTPEVCCRWFSGGEVRDSHFPAEALRRRPDLAALA